MPAVVAVALSVVLLVVLRRHRERHHASAPVVGFLAGLSAAIAVTTAAANRHVTRWEDADLDVLAPLLLTLGGVVVAAIAVLLVLDRPAPSAGREASSGSARVAWSGTARSGVVVALGVGLVVIAGLVGLLVGAVVMAVLEVAVGIGMVAGFASVRVTVGRHGLTARSPIGWPSVTIPLEEIVAVEATTLEPLQWGGWGYRGSLRVLGRAAWILRRGEGLALQLTDGRSFAVTVDGAAEAASVLREVSR